MVLIAVETLQVLGKTLGLPMPEEGLEPLEEFESAYCEWN